MILAGVLALSWAALAVPVPIARAECPEWQLSCGRQRPVMSDGVRPFENEEFGLRVTFPRGSAVCMTRSGDAPRGFFAWYDPGPPCAERGDRPARFISVYAQFNALFFTALDQVAGDCGPLSPGTRRRLGPRGLAIPGYRSMTCEAYDSKSDTIELTVHALAGPWQDFGRPELRSRRAVYQITLGTTPARLDADLARFRRVLDSIRIAPGR